MTKIVGAKGNIQDIDSFLKKIKSISQQYNLVIQVFNADMIYDKIHLISAVEHANRAIEQKTDTTNSLEMEILLYASGERQLKLAIPKMGVKKGRGNIAMVFTSGKISDIIIEQILNELDLKRDDKLLEGDINTLKKFGLNNKEIETVNPDKYGHLILERIAMVDIIK